MALLSSIKQFEGYMGSSPKAEDFTQYWEEGLREMLKGNFSYSVYRKDVMMKGIEVYDLYFKGVNNERIHCELLKPEKIEKPIPGVMMFHGYTSNIDSIYSKVPYAYNDMAVLAMDVPGQGGTSEDNYSADGPTIYGQMIRGVADPDKKKLLYRGIYLDAIKASLIFSGLTFVDEKRLGATGKSQGGALSIVTAALNRNMKAIAPVYPFLGDFRVLFEKNLFGDIYTEFRSWFRKYDTLHEKEDEFFERLSYIDVQNFASMVKAKTLMVTALEDKTCPPITQFAIYNKLECEKDLKVYCDYDHERLPYSDDIIFEYFRKNL